MDETKSVNKKENKNLDKVKFYTKWWFWTIIALALIIVALLCTKNNCYCPKCSNEIYYDNGSQSNSPTQLFEKKFDSKSFSGVGVNTTDNFELPNGVYNITFSYTNNLERGRSTNFISSLVCKDSYGETMTNDIESSGNGSKSIKMSKNDTCFFEVENASYAAEWTFSIEQKK